jgi:3-oxoacyl-[acyl-carrier protein] reductase
LDRRINNINVGQKVELIHKITQADIEKFIDLTGDDNPLHCNEEYAKNTSFKGVVSHGMLTASFISTIVGKKLPGDGALWISQSLNFLLPVRVNDELVFESEVIKIQKREAILHIETKVYNQNGKKVLTGIGLVKLLDSENNDSVGDNLSKLKPEKDKINFSGEKIVLVLGASGGIGSSIALKLSEKNYTVVVHYNKSLDKAKELAFQIEKRGGKTYFVGADLNEEHDVNSMFDEIEKNIGKVYYIVNCVSSPIKDKAFEISHWNDFQLQINSQIKGTFNSVKRAIPNMLADKRGSFVNIGSTVTEGVPPLKWTSYSLAKSALKSLVKSLANEYGNKGIRFNLVSPGMTDTDFISEIPEKNRLIHAAQTPMRRLVKPEDVASAVIFLLSDEASFITGENLVVSGGKLML